MRVRPLALLVFALPALACVTMTPRFEDVVRVAASKHPRACSTPYTVKALNDHGYRVDACEGTLFYHCWYRRKSMGRVQCCALVADAAAATAVFSVASSEVQCLEFAD